MQRHLLCKRHRSVFGRKRSSENTSARTVRQRSVRQCAANRRRSRPSPARRCLTSWRRRWHRARADKRRRPHRRRRRAQCRPVVRVMRADDQLSRQRQQTVSRVPYNSTKGMRSAGRDKIKQTSNSKLTKEREFVTVAHKAGQRGIERCAALLRVRITN